jgi:general secretion pathway protein D
MTRVCVLFVCLFVSLHAWAVEAKDSLSLAFDRLPLQQLVILYYDQCEKKGIVFDSAVSKLEELVTLKTPTMPCPSVKALMLDLMARAGVGLEVRSGYDLVHTIRLPEERDDWKTIIYRPKFRDAVELAELAMIAVRKGGFAHQRRVAQVQGGSAAAGSSQVPETGTNGASLTGKAVDKLVFMGPADEVTVVSSLLSRLDVPVGQVEVSMGVYEYQSGSSTGSAINAALSLFKGRIGLTVEGGASGGSSLRLALPSLDAALSVLDQDSHFRYVARPKVTVRDGEQASFQSGQDVRVVGAVSVDRNGNQVQSITTMSAGVTVQALPVIRGEVVDLTLRQLVSDFVASPNADPSVVKRDLSTRLDCQPGQVYVIGGLQTNRKTVGKRRFFGLETGSTAEGTQTEILILVSVKPESFRLLDPL